MEWCVESRHPCLVLIFFFFFFGGGVGGIVFIKYDVTCSLFIDALYQVKEVPSCS